MAKKSGKGSVPRSENVKKVVLVGPPQATILLPFRPSKSVQEKIALLLKKAGLKGNLIFELLNRTTDGIPVYTDIEGYKAIGEGERVTFEVEESHDGPRAFNVQPLPNEEDRAKHFDKDNGPESRILDKNHEVTLKEDEQSPGVWAERQGVMDGTDLENAFNGASQREIGEMLLAARKKAGMTQENVAEKMSTDPSNIIRLEKGRASPTIKTLVKYADAVGAQLELRLVVE